MSPQASADKDRVLYDSLSLKLQRITGLQIDPKPMSFSAPGGYGKKKETIKTKFKFWEVRPHSSDRSNGFWEKRGDHCSAWPPGGRQDLAELNFVWSPSPSVKGGDWNSLPPEGRDNVRKVIIKLTSEDNKESEEAIIRLRELSGLARANGDTILELEGLPKLVVAMQNNSSIMQEHAVTTILNVSCDVKNTKVLLDGQIVPSVLQVLKSGGQTAKSNAAALLYNLSASPLGSQHVATSGAIPLLLQMLRDVNRRCRLDAVKAIANLARSEENLGALLKAEAAKELAQLLSEQDWGEDDEQLPGEVAAAALSCMAKYPLGRAAVAKCNGISALGHAFNCSRPLAREYALSAFLQFTSTSDDQNNDIFFFVCGTLEHVAERSTGRLAKLASIMVPQMLKFYHNQDAHDD